MMMLWDLFLLFNAQLALSETNYQMRKYNEIFISEGYFANLSKIVVEESLQIKCGVLATQMNKSMFCHEENICTLLEIESPPDENAFKLAKRCFTTFLPKKPKCPPNYEHVAYDGYEDLGCIKLVLDPSTWDDARSKCQAEGADLVTLKENPNDMTPLILLRQEKNVQELWVGIRLTSTPGIWQWINDGAQINESSTLWNGDQPNDQGILCGSYGWWLDQKLNDNYCGIYYSYLCQKPTQN